MVRRSSAYFQMFELRLAKRLNWIQNVAFMLRVLLLFLYNFECISTGRESGSSFAKFTFLFILYGADLLFRISRPLKAISKYCIFCELFYYQVLTYRYPYLIIIEQAIIILCMINIAIQFSFKTSVPINVFLGFIWLPSMSYTGNTNVSLKIGNYDFLYQNLQRFNYPVYTLLAVCFSIVLYFLKQCISEQKRREVIIHNLDNVNRSLSEKMFSIQAESSEKARKEIFKNLHDNIGYIMTNLIMMLQATEAVMQADPSRGKEMLSNSVKYGCQSMDEIRQYLRGASEKAKTNINVQREIRALTLLFEKSTGIEVVTQFGNWPSTFTSEINAFLLSFIKEVLTNAVKHALATKIVIHCNNDSKCMASITVSNNGLMPGNDLTYGMGLSGIEESLQHIGGTMRIQHTSIEFVIHVSFPFVQIQYLQK